jgi:hypothetical protein
VVGDYSIFVDSTATVTDGGSPNFDGGSLSVTIVTNASIRDLITIEPQGSGIGEIDVQGTNVTFGGVAFGTFAGGVGTNALGFAFNTNATPAVVTALMRQLTFETDNTNTASRTLQFIVADGDGGVSLPTLRTLVLDRPPIAVDDLLIASEAVTFTIPLSQILSNDYDMDGDVISLSAFSGVSANGGRVTITNASLTYRPPIGATNTTAQDHFAYAIQDGRGGEDIGIITIKPIVKNKLQMSMSGASGVTLTMAGTPGRSYEIQASADLVTWVILNTVTASPTGIISVLDTAAGNNPQRFYRTKAN